MRQVITRGLIALVMIGQCLWASDSPTPSASEILTEQVLSIPQECLSLWGYPLYHPQDTGWFGAGMLGLMAVDVETTRFVQAHVEPHFESQVPELNLFPAISGTDEYLGVGILGLYLSSYVIGNAQGQQAAIGSAKAVVYSLLYTHLTLKGIAGRQRPVRPLDGDKAAPEPLTKDPWNFGNFHPLNITSDSNGTAFPSYHFSLFFSVGKVIERVYDNPWLGYGIAAFGLLPHFRGHNHWVSDMVGGALIGQLIGNTVYEQMSGDARPESSKDLLFRPYMAAGELGLHCSQSFSL